LPPVNAFASKRFDVALFSQDALLERRIRHACPSKTFHMRHPRPRDPSFAEPSARVTCDSLFSDMTDTPIIEKPFVPDALARKLREVLDGLPALATRSIPT
jgi:hypothetical protein